MPSKDPWASLPNLGDTPKTHSELNSSEIETIRSAGDPSRFFPSSRGGSVDAVTGRINDQPRGRIYRTTGIVGFGPGAQLVQMDVVDYDTDRMCPPDIAGGWRQIYATTPGLYVAVGNMQWLGGGGVTGMWTRIIVNNDPTIVVAERTDYRDAGLFGAHQTITGLWLAKAGDSICLYGYAGAATNAGVGRYGCYLSACMISTLGSD